MNIKKQIPNTLTLANLFCGLLAVLILTKYWTPFGSPDDTEQNVLMHVNQLNTFAVAGLMILAMIFDFFDGMLARLLNVMSPIGKELDSLADGVTFGVVPALIMYRMIREVLEGGGEGVPEFMTGDTMVTILPMIGLVVSLFSAYRLAKFNVDERQGDTFYGLPTPANAVLILSFYLTATFNPGAWYTDILTHPFVLIGLSLLCSILLVADIRLIALKFKNMTWKDNSFRFILMGSSVILLATLWHRAVPLIILLYFVLSIVQNQIDKKKKTE